MVFFLGGAKQKIAGSPLLDFFLLELPLLDFLLFEFSVHELPVLELPRLGVQVLCLAFFSFLFTIACEIIFKPVLFLKTFNLAYLPQDTEYAVTHKEILLF